MNRIVFIITVLHIFGCYVNAGTSRKSSEAKATEITHQKTERTRQKGKSNSEIRQYEKPKAGDVWNNGIGMEFVWIPMGQFLMGTRTPKSDSTHNVRISKGFWLGRKEVTQKQWAALMPTNPSRVAKHSLPVNGVNWYECVDYCNKLSQLDGYAYRLPTEAEWEYACRAKSLMKLDDELDVSLYTNDLVAQPLPIGSTEPNPWNLLNMNGGVGEWCSDWYGSYDRETQIDPIGPEKGRFRIWRGGVGGSVFSHQKASKRMAFKPNKRSFFVGFRIVRECR